MTRFDTPPQPTLLVVDDVHANIALLAEVLRSDYRIRIANSGARALALIEAEPPDLILLDVMMPGLSGHEVCRRLKQDPRTAAIPVIFVTALGEAEDERLGLELGAVDYITKPINPAVVRARVRTHLQLREQALQLQQLIDTLEERVAAGIRENERLTRLKRFFSPQVADLILASQGDDYQRTRRCEVVVVFLDIRGYTAFTERADPAELMRVLDQFHATTGPIIMRWGATLEHFGGDSIMVFLNAPLPTPQPALTACRMALEMQTALDALAAGWRAQGFDLGVAIGIAQGLATVGMIGFEGRRDYGAIGPATNLAARLCSQGLGGQILVSASVQAEVGAELPTRAVGELALKGFQRPVPAFELLPDDGTRHGTADGQAAP